MAKFAVNSDNNNRILIRIRDLDFAYPTGGFRLQLGALDIAQGERLAVVGASGSGKTTLLDLMAGIRLPGTGSIQVKDEDITRMPDAERRAYRIRNVGLIFQSFELLDYLTVRDNILLPYRLSAALNGLAEAGNRVDALAEETKIMGQLAATPISFPRGNGSALPSAGPWSPHPKSYLLMNPRAIWIRPISSGCWTYCLNRLQAIRPRWSW